MFGIRVCNQTWFGATFFSIFVVTALQERAIFFCLCPARESIFSFFFRYSESAVRPQHVVSQPFRINFSKFTSVLLISTIQVFALHRSLLSREQQVPPDLVN